MYVTFHGASGLHRRPEIIANYKCAITPGTMSLKISGVSMLSYGSKEVPSKASSYLCRHICWRQKQRESPVIYYWRLPLSPIKNLEIWGWKNLFLNSQWTMRVANNFCRLKILRVLAFKFATNSKRLHVILWLQGGGSLKNQDIILYRSVFDAWNE